VVDPFGFGFYPWGYGGLGFGYYDPWSPYGAGYGGYGGYGGSYPSYSSGQSDDEGAVRIRVKPREASVYTDGYFVGHVDDFDGLLQKLHLSTGPHRIEVRGPQYEPLTFDVRIERGQTITYRGELRRLP
jgi:PEGA domain